MKNLKNSKSPVFHKFHKQIRSPMKKKEIRIALLLGGTSPERAVSKATGKAINKQLRELGYNVKLIDPAYGLNQPNDEHLFFADEDYAPLNNRNCIDALNSELLNDIDLAFLALHGKWSEDGSIQAILDLRGIKYTGSGVLASALAMDKSVSKIMFQHFDVHTPKWFVVQTGDQNYSVIKDKINKFFGYPCVIKPNDQGSTIGLTICKEESLVEEGIKLALTYSDKAIVEEYIAGHEVTVAILDKDALPVLEIKPKHYLYDYECKYTYGMSDYIVPAQIPQNVAQHLQHQALLAFHSVGCKGYGRVDFRMTDDYKAFCLEVNTLPGMTDTSLVPKMAKAAGINFSELLERIINLAI